MEGSGPGLMEIPAFPSSSWKKYMENLSMDILCLGWNSNRAPLGYMSESLPLKPT
jgi:hypothetical protein